MTPQEIANAVAAAIAAATLPLIARIEALEAADNSTQAALAQISDKPTDLAEPVLGTHDEWMQTVLAKYFAADAPLVVG